MNQKEISVATAVETLFGKSVLVLTGAGISTDSGIPDYRSPSSPPRNPMTYQQFLSDFSYRRHYWARNFVGYQFMVEKRPNASHIALAAWGQRIGQNDLGTKLSGIVTQNVDTLHQKAGSKNVVDLHGRYDQVHCIECHTEYSREFMQGMMTFANPGFSVKVKDVEIAPDADAVLEDTADFIVPPCPNCGGIIKPSVVYFGQTVPKDKLARAIGMLDQSDSLLILGSSLAVHSGLRFALKAQKDNKPVVIVNRGATRGDHLAAVKLDLPLIDVVPRMAAELGSA